MGGDHWRTCRDTGRSRTDMAVHRCRRCSMIWTSNATRGSFVTKLCPECIALIPVLNWEMTR